MHPIVLSTTEENGDQGFFGIMRDQHGPAGIAFHYSHLYTTNQLVIYRWEQWKAIHAGPWRSAPFFQGKSILALVLFSFSCISLVADITQLCGFA